MKARLLAMLMSTAMLVTSVQTPAYAAAPGAGTETGETVIEQVVEGDAAATDEEIVISENEGTEPAVGGDAVTEPSADGEIIADDGAEGTIEEIVGEGENIESDADAADETPVIAVASSADSHTLTFSIGEGTEKKDYSITVALTPSRFQVAGVATLATNETGLTLYMNDTIRKEDVSVPLTYRAEGTEGKDEFVITNLSSRTTYNFNQIEVRKSGKAIAKAKGTKIAVKTLAGTQGGYISVAEDTEEAKAVTYKSVKFDVEVGDVEGTYGVFALDEEMSPGESGEVELKEDGDGNDINFGEVTVSGLNPGTKYKFYLFDSSMTSVLDTITATTEDFPGTIEVDVPDDDITTTSAKVKVKISDYTGAADKADAVVIYTGEDGKPAAIHATAKAWTVADEKKSAKFEITIPDDGEAFKAESAQVIDVLVCDTTEEINDVEDFVSFVTKTVEFNTKASAIGASLEATWDDTNGMTVKLKRNASDNTARTFQIKGREVGVTAFDSNISSADDVNIAANETEKSETYAKDKFAPGTQYEFVVEIDGTTVTTTKEVPLPEATDATITVGEPTAKIQGIALPVSIEKIGSTDIAKTYNVSVDVLKVDVLNGNTYESVGEIIAEGGSPNALTKDSPSAELIFGDDDVTPGIVNKFRVTVRRDVASDPETVFVGYYDVDLSGAARQPIYGTGTGTDEASFKMYCSQAIKDETFVFDDASVSIYYREVGETTWKDSSTDTNEDSFGKYYYWYIDELKSNTIYEVKIGLSSGDSSALSSVRTFTTKSFYGSINVNVNDVRFDTATIEYRLSGNLSNIPYEKIYIREKNSRSWRETDEDLYGITLTPGTSYEVRIECTTEDEPYAEGKSVVAYAETEFKTLEAEYAATASATTSSDTDDSYATVNFGIKAVNGETRGIFKARLVLKAEDGSSKNGSWIYLVSGEGYAGTDDIPGLSAGKEYSVYVALERSFKNGTESTIASTTYPIDTGYSFVAADLLKDESKDPTSITLEATRTTLNVSSDTGNAQKTTRIEVNESVKTPSKIQWTVTEGTGVVSISPTAGQSITATAQGVGKAKIEASYDIGTAETPNVIKAEIEITVVDYSLVYNTEPDASKTAVWKAEDQLAGGTFYTGETIELAINDKPATGDATQITEGLSFGVSGEPDALTFAGNKVTAGAYANATATLSVTLNGVTLKRTGIKVKNAIKGVSVLQPVGANYAAIPDEKNDDTYTVANGDTYTLTAVASPIYTTGTKTTYRTINEYVKFEVVSGNATIAAGSDDVKINGTGAIDVKATLDVSKFAGGKELAQGMTAENAPSYTIHLNALDVPQTGTNLTATYMWYQTNNTLTDDLLPEGWTWAAKDYKVYKSGVYSDFYAVPSDSSLYPLSKQVDVTALDYPTIDLSLDDGQTAVAGVINADLNKFFISTAAANPIKMTAKLDGTARPAYATYALYALSDAGATGKGAQNLSVAQPTEANKGKIEVKAAADGTYAMRVYADMRYPRFNDKGALIKSTEEDNMPMAVAIDATIVAATSMPVRKILQTKDSADKKAPKDVDKIDKGGFEWVDNDGTKTVWNLLYKIGDKPVPKTTFTLPLDVFDISSASDTEANKVKEPALKVTSSDTAIAKAVINKTDKSAIDITIPAKAAGMATIKIQGNDPIGSYLEFNITIKDYNPKAVKTGKPVLNKLKSDEKWVMDILVPYENDLTTDGKKENELTKALTLVKQSDKAPIEGISLNYQALNYTYTATSYRVWAQISDPAKVTEKAGTIKAAVCVNAKAVGKPVYLNVNLKLTDKLPTVTVNVAKKPNVFYTDATEMAYNTNANNKKDPYDGNVAMGVLKLKVSDGSTIESVVWRPGDTDVKSTTPSAVAKNSEFMVNYDDTDPIDYALKSYVALIKQNHPTLSSKHVPTNKEAVEGNLYFYLNGYEEPIVKHVKFATEYKKPKLKVGTFYYTPDIGIDQYSNTVYTSARNQKNDNVTTAVTAGTLTNSYKLVKSSNGNVTIGTYGTSVRLDYDGEKSTTTNLTYYSDYWYEPLTLKAKLSVVKSKLITTPATITLNAAYPSEERLTQGKTQLYNNSIKSAMGGYSEISVTGANKNALDLLAKGLISFRTDKTNGNIYVNLNNAKAMQEPKYPTGTFSFKVNAVKNGTTMPATLKVKVISQKASVKVSASGAIDVVKNPYWTWSKNVCTDKAGAYVKATAKFAGLDSDYRITSVSVTGENRGLFDCGYSSREGTITPTSLTGWNANRANFKNEVYIYPKTADDVVPGKTYRVYLSYTISDANASGGTSIYLTSQPVNIKIKQSTPRIKVDNSGKATIYVSQDNAAQLQMELPDNFKDMDVAGANIDYDVTGDGIDDINVSYTGGGKTDNIVISILDRENLKATTGGKTYSIKLPVEITGGGNKTPDAIVNLKVTIKK